MARKAAEHASLPMTRKAEATPAVESRTSPRAQQVRIASLQDIPSEYKPVGTGLYKKAHSVWELRGAEDEKGGYTLTRLHEERDSDILLSAPQGRTAQKKTASAGQGSFYVPSLFFSRVSFAHEGQIQSGVVVDVDVASGHVQVRPDEQPKGVSIMIPQEMLIGAPTGPVLGSMEPELGQTSGEDEDAADEQLEASDEELELEADESEEEEEESLESERYEGSDRALAEHEEGDEVMPALPAEGGSRETMRPFASKAMARYAQKLMHYSPKPGLTELDPARMGDSQLSRREREDMRVKVTFYYFEGTEPETLIRSTAKARYEAQLPEGAKLLDLASAPDYVVQALREDGRGGMYLAIKNAGFFGFYNSESQLPNACAVFYKLPVTETDRNKDLRSRLASGQLSDEEMADILLAPLEQAVLD